MAYLRPIRFIGNKNHFVDEFLSLEKSLSIDSDWTFIEPFVGSGSVFLNKQEQYKTEIINDKDRNLIRIWRSFQSFNTVKYVELLDYITIEFGDIKKDKPSWYEFRNWFNKYHWNTDTFEEGILLLMLCNSTINSIFRFGPNGFNSSYGGRYKMPTIDDFLAIKESLKNVQILNYDWTKIIQDSDKTLIFVDPPYYSRNIQSYVENFDAEHFDRFLNALTNMTKSKVIYTDIVNDINSSYMKGWKHKIIKEIKNINPHNSSKTTGFEAVYYNF